MKNKLLNISLLLFSFFACFATIQLHAAESNEEDIVFVILTHIRDAADDDMFHRCYDSIREFYPTVPVVAIDDNSSYPMSLNENDDFTVVQSEYPGAGEILPYYYFLKYRWASKMIFLHDSMRVIRPFTAEELKDPVKFHWYFETHAWDAFYPAIDLLSKLNHASDLIHFNTQHHLWYGCFGVASTVDLDALQQVEDKYNMTEILAQNVYCRNQRCALERIYALIMFKEGYLKPESCANFGEIFSHPSAYTHIPEEGINAIKNSDYPHAIVKTWRGR